MHARSLKCSEEWHSENGIMEKIYYIERESELWAFFQPLDPFFLQPIIKLKQVLDPIPFANENAGTMRLRDVHNSKTAGSEVSYSDADEAASSEGQSDLASDLASERSGEIVSPKGAGKAKTTDKR